MGPSLSFTYFSNLTYFMYSSQQVHELSAQFYYLNPLFSFQGHIQCYSSKEVGAIGLNCTLTRTITPALCNAFPAYSNHSKQIIVISAYTCNDFFLYLLPKPTVEYPWVYLGVVQRLSWVTPPIDPRISRPYISLQKLIGYKSNLTSCTTRF